MYLSLMLIMQTQGTYTFIMLIIVLTLLALIYYITFCTLYH